MKASRPTKLRPPTLAFVALSFVPLGLQAAEPAGGEQEAPAPARAASKRKHHAKPRSLEQLVSQPPEFEEPPSMLQKEPAAEGAPCQSDPAELQILLALRERRLELDGRERTVQAREVEFKQAQKKIDDRVEQLNQSVARLEARLELGEPGRQAREARLKTLVDGLSTLSAKKAAPILAETEPNLVAELMQRLGSTRTATLLAVMPTVKAARIVNITGGPRQPGTRNSPQATAATPPASPAKPDKPQAGAAAAAAAPSAPAAASTNPEAAATPADAAAPTEPEKKP
jgi:flagellar motility protein MotE (MotC chaperone)